MPEAGEIANGQTYTGRQALEFGLIDEIGGIDEAVSYLQKNKKIAFERENIIEYSIYNSKKNSVLNSLITNLVKNFFAKKSLDTNNFLLY